MGEYVYIYIKSKIEGILMERSEALRCDGAPHHT